MKRKVTFFSLVVLISGLSVGPGIRAEVRLPALIGDNMVLQRKVQTRIWGTAAGGEAVRVAIADQSRTATADRNGNWQVVLAPMKAGGPFDMTVTGKNGIAVTVKNILVGEVWVGSGQSNMRRSVELSGNAVREMAQANFPDIRLFTVPQQVSPSPLKEIPGQWVPCDPATVANFSAAAYYFGRELYRDLKVPVGLISSSLGGSPAQSWTSLPVLAGDPDFKADVRNWKNYGINYPKAKAEYEQKLARWNKETEQAKREKKPLPPAPVPPVDPAEYPYQPGGLYNAMIAPLVPYTIRGVIWYQGEGNLGDAGRYRRLFPLLIADWRRAWGQGDFPFLFVQLANFGPIPPQPGDSPWAELREAQAMALAVPKTGMATAIDIGEAGDIHPQNKQEVGRRLALVAEALVYGQAVTYSGPSYDSMRIEGNKIRLRFQHSQGALKAPNSEPVKGFAIAGKDKKFVWAEAKIDGETVVVWSDKVASPTAVRYAWADNPVCNLYNRAGLPAVPFRTDAGSETTDKKQ